jgi:hypothetical protein
MAEQLGGCILDGVENLRSWWDAGLAQIVATQCMDQHMGPDVLFFHDVMSEVAMIDLQLCKNTTIQTSDCWPSCVTYCNHHLGRQ